MNEDVSESAEALVTVARAVKTRGLKGEIEAELLTDFPDRFSETSHLIAVAPDGKRRTVELEGYWLHQTRVVLKIVGRDTIESASEFVGHEFAVPESQRVPLPEGHFYDWELEGCVVENIGGTAIGHVREVMRIGAGVEMLVVVDDAQHDHLVPMVQSIVVDIDIARKRVQIDPPEGLLEL